MDKNYNKVSFNLQQEANAKFQEMLDKGSYSNKTELLNEAILALYNKCSVADVSQESFAEDKVEHQFSHGHAKSCVERCDVVCETDFHQMLPDDYYWSLLAYLINPYLYPAPNLYWC